MTNERSRENKQPIIFAAFADDVESAGGHLGSLTLEARQLRDGLDAAKHRDHYRFVERQGASLDDILKVLQKERHRIAVFHYAGHSGSYELLFQGQYGGNELIDAEAFARLLAEQGGLHLVFLNGCANQEQIDGLLNAGVRSIVATSDRIEDRLATQFAAFFYESLGNGASLRTAFNESSTAMDALPYTREILGDDPLPWKLVPESHAEDAHEWSLVDAIGDPRFGLPLLPRLDLPSEPFRYLEWFRSEDAEIFFGRNREISELYNLIVADNGSPLILYYGQSGVGKSSLLAAGLLPRLEKEYQVIYVRREHVLGLTGTLAQALDQSPLISPSQFHEAWCLAEKRSRKPLLVVLDQVEECYTRSSLEQPDEMGEFVAVLAAIFGDIEMRPQGTMLLGFRKEWLAEIGTSLSQGGLPFYSLFLEQMGKDAIEQVVLGPTNTQRLRYKYRLRVENGLAREIAETIGADPGSSVAPMLQVLLSNLWGLAQKEDQANPSFTQALYQPLRRQGILLDDFLTQQFKVLLDRQKASVESGLLLDLLAQHTTPLGTSEQCTTAALLAIYPHQREAVESLLAECHNLYLLVDPAKDQKGAEPTSRLAHDTLAPVVRKRFDESDAPGQRAWRILESRVGRNLSDRLSGDNDLDNPKPADIEALGKADLTIVEAGLNGMRAPIGREIDLIEVSRRARDSGVRATWILRAAGTAALLLIIGFALAAALAAYDAASQRSLVRSRELTTSSIEKLEIDPEFSILALVAALENYAYTSDAEGALRLASMRNFAEITLDDQSDAAINVVAYSPNGSEAATGDANGQIYRWYTDNGQRVEDPSDEPMKTSNGVEALIYSPGGDRIIAGDESVVVSWELGAFNHSSRSDVVTTEHLSTVRALALSPDGQYLASGDWNGLILIHRSLSNGGWNTIARLGNYVSVNDLTFSPDGAYLATGSRANGSINLWRMADIEACDVERCQPHQTLGQHNEEILGLAFGPCRQSAAEGECTSWLASASRDKTAKIWSINEDFEPIELRHPGSVFDVLFDTSGRYLVTAAADSNLRLWDLEQQEVVATLAGHRQAVNRIALDPVHKNRILSGSRDGSARIWSLPRPAAPVEAVAFSEDGQLLATGYEDGRFEVWTFTDGERKELATESEHGESIEAVAFQPNGTDLALVSANGFITTTNTNSWRSRGINCGAELISLAYTPNGETIVATSTGSPPNLYVIDADMQGECSEWNVIDRLSAIEISADGQFVIASAFYDEELHLYSLADKSFTQPQASYPLMTNAAHDIRLNPMDSNQIFISAGNSVAAASIYRLDTGQRDHLFTDIDGHTAQVNTLAVDTLGTQLATGGSDDKVVIWNLSDADDEPISLVLPAVDEVHAVDFHPSKPYIAVGDGQGNVAIHSLTTEDAIREALRSLTHLPSPADCQEIFGSVDICHSFIEEMFRSYDIDHSAVRNR